MADHHTTQLRPLTDQEADLQRRADARLRLPEYIGLYRIIREIGAGSSGRVYEAHDPSTDRRVALKWLREGAPPDMRAMFLDEARRAARLEHPHVCPIYATGEQYDRPYIVSRLFGETLGDRLGADVPPTLHEVLRWVRDIANGLDALHTVGLVHRDVKPTNVLLDSRTGTVALTDFGLAIPYEIGTGTGLAGTPLYMSPEQWQNGPITPKSDVFNLGVLLYRALTETHPFDAVDRSQIAQRVLRDQPHRPSELRLGIDPRIDELVLRALAKNPADRPTAKEFADEIDGILAGLERKPQPRTSQLALQLSATAPEGTAPKQIQADLLELYKALNDYHLALGGSGLKPVSPRPGAGE